MKTPGHARQGVFISYAREDGEPAARALQARLAVEVPDVPAWLDRYEIEGGIGWWNQIEQQLDRAEFLILVMTPAAMASENTRREWRSARQRGVCVYPVKGVPDSDLDYASLPNWIGKAHFYDPDLEWHKLVAHLRRGCLVTRVPYMAPPLPPSFVPRPRETDALIHLLETRETTDPIAITTALRGAGGFGKTTLAAAICHDDRVLDAFDDGILWVTLGQSPNLLNELVKLYAALTGERPGFVDVEDAARELALRLESRNCLIVIDDAWNAAHVRPFLSGGPGCARLVTTRLFEVAVEARRVDVDQMEPAEALQLLLARAGVAPPDLEPFRRLVARLGEWPLPIKLAGSAMRQRLERGDTAMKALDYVVRALDKRGITAFDTDQTSGREGAVARTIGASLDLLAPEAQQHCADLSIFPEDAAIPLATARTLWQLDDIDAEDLARRLDDLALVEFDLRSGHLRIHDVLRAFLAARVPDAAAVHGRLIDSWGDAYALPDGYVWRRYAYHLRGAARNGRLRELLLDPHWIDAKLRATDIHALIADFEHAPQEPVLTLVRDALRLSAPGVAANPRQLDAQLVGRLLSRSELEVVAFRERVCQSANGPWLRVLHPTLDAPGGMLLMTLVGHEGEVTSLASDAGQRTLFSASNDGTLRVWDARDGQLLYVLRHRTLGARAVSSSRDGALAVSGGADGLIYLWDVARGERIQGFWGERGPGVTAVALSADGGLAVSGSRELVLRVWDVDGRRLLRLLDGHRERVTSVALSADGGRAVSGSDDWTVRVWNVTSGALERTLEGHAGPVDAVAISGDGRHALSGSSDRTLKLWDAETGTCVRTLAGHAAGVTSVGLAEGAWRALSGSSDRSARLWDLHNGTVLATFDGHSDAVTAVHIDDAGIQAATGSVDRTIKLWRLDDLRAPVSMAAHAGAVISVVFSADSRLCASGGDDGRVIVRDVESGRLMKVIDAHTAPVRSLAFTQDGTCVLSAGVDDQYWLWTIEDGAGTWMPVRHVSPVDYCALSASARYLTTSCGDRFVYVWDVPSGALVERYGTRRLFNHLITPSRRRAVLPADAYLDSYLPGESVYDVMVIRMSADGTRALFSATSRQRGSLRAAAQQPTRAAATASSDSACILALNLSTGEVQSVNASQHEPVNAFTLDAEGTRLLWARADHSLELWDLRRDQHLTTLQGHSEKVNAVAFTRDGKRAVSCSRDRSARVWSLETGEEIAAFTADAALRSLAVASHDDAIAVGDVAGRLHVLRLVGG
jgi:WD40 repeat protein